MLHYYSLVETKCIAKDAGRGLIIFSHFLLIASSCLVAAPNTPMDGWLLCSVEAKWEFLSYFHRVFKSA